MVTRTRFSVPFLRILLVFSTSDLGRMCTRYTLYYTYIAYLSERHKKKSKSLWIPLQAESILVPPTSCLPVSMSSHFLLPRILVTSHTHVKQVTPTEVHTIVATEGPITLSYDTFVARSNIGVSARAPAVIVVCWDRVVSLPTLQSGQVADSSDLLRPGPPTGCCKRFHGLSEAHWVNDISIVLLPLRFGTGVSEIRSYLVSITDSSVDKVTDYVTVDFRHGHQFLFAVIL
jgi:hypothetical protein